MVLKDTTVTADAMNCQRETVAAIVEGKGDYVLALKENHPVFYQEVPRHFGESVLEGLQKKADGTKEEESVITSAA